MKKKVMCLIFLLALIVPTISWLAVKNLVNTENREKREYAGFPELSAANYKNIPSGLEAWFNDRLPYKNQLVALNAEIKKDTRLQSNWMDYIGGVGVIFGKDGWLFHNGNTGESTINDYIGNNLYSEAKLKELAAGYQKLADQYAAEGIEFILFIPTNKEQVYPEFMPEDLVPVSTISRTDQLVDYLQEHTTVPVLYTKEELIKAKSPDYNLFYKYDSHWNTVGAFVGSQMIRRELTGEYTDLSEATVYFNNEVQDPRDLADVLGLDDSYNEHGSWDVTDYKMEVTGGFATEAASPEAGFMVFTSTAEDDRELVIIKDSFVFGMIQTLARDFATLTMIGDSNYAKDYIAKNHPDVVILEIVERQFYRMEHQWEELVTE